MKKFIRFTIAIVGIIFISTSFSQSQNCVVPDNGTGTATLPPIGCQYQSVDPFMIIDGLPPGTTIEIHGIYSDFTCCGSSCPICSLPLMPGECEMPGGSLGGDGHCFIGIMLFDVIGTGDLEGFNRTLYVEIFSEIHTGPRNPGDPVQSFPADYYRFEGELLGDPDFCTFHIIAGSDFGLPSPGNTTLTQLPSGDFAVDSFFDITYQIDFEGCPGSVLEGLAGITTATTGFEIPFFAENDFIDPGPDFWTVPEAGMNFGGEDLNAIPADFFGPGSDPFDGQVYMEGGALEPLPFPDFHTRIDRITQGDVPSPYPITDQIETEIIELKLVSIAPITVTYDGGMIPEEWHVEVELSSVFQPIGNMDVTKLNPDGGEFGYNTLNIFPKFIFTLITNPLEKRTLDIGELGMNPLHYFTGTFYPWEHSPIGNDFNPLGTEPMELYTLAEECFLNLLPYLLRQDNFWVELDPGGVFIGGGGSGYNDGEWYYYSNTDWWNIWFYDHPFEYERTKAINVSFTLDRLYPDLPSYANIVFNWSTGPWSEQGVPGRPPLPEDVFGDPGLEDLYIVRSTPIFYGDINGPIIIDQFFYEILEYNPEWISIDIEGINFTIPDGIINHVCLQDETGGDLFEFGDAPEMALAYPSLNTIGLFPTCMNEPVAGYIAHIDGSAWFGPQFDYEPEGNAGLCPTFNPDTYNQDECFNDGDAGLIFPEGYTITGTVGSEVVQPCTGANGTPLGYTCQTAEWGVDIDIDLHNHIPSGDQAYINLLIDWDQNGQWGGSIDCPGFVVPEHVLVDFVIPNPFDGPLSALMATASTIPIGPNPGYVWVRFSITDFPVGMDWNGEGFFEYGETEDYLLLVLEEEEEIDWGDAPDGSAAPQYPTLAINNGANHTIDNITYLGVSIDGENNGIPDVNALGDDNDNIDDEDGVILPAALIIGQSVTIDVIASVDGYLNAWLDFDNNGNWSDAIDQIFFDENLVAGTNSITFNIPASATAGITFTRFRFDSFGGLNFDGPASNGEVEDYEVELRSEDMFKWEQLPDLSFFGLDVDATNDIEGNQPPHILADDFECTMTGPITNIKVWGSWIYDYLPFGMDPEAVVFTLSIHADIPAGVVEEWSMPGEVLWWRTFSPGEFTVDLYADGLQEGWYDPVSGNYLPFGDTQCWLYSFAIDTNYFIQTGTPDLPVIYWLDVQAQPLDPEPDCRFGWKTSEMHWNDDGVWTVGLEPYNGMWNELIYPPGHELQGQSIDLAFRITGEESQEQIDWGDAPDNPQIPQYPTLAVNNGANHIVDNITYLGVSIDSENNGIPHPNALGDDNDNIDDEDGVIFTSPLIPGFNATIDIIASVPGILNAWFDFNIDGGWAELGDQIFIDKVLNPGINNLNFNIPPGTVSGITFARFRFSTVAGISYVGQVSDGEVEDYEVYIESPPEKWWIQEPDLSDLGLDVDATAIMPSKYPFNILADDFYCDQTGPITTIGIWGSWYHDHYPWFEDPGSVMFTLSIHKDIPADQSPTGYSMPGEVIWLGMFGPGQFMYELYAGGLYEGWYDPAIPLYEPFGDTECWKYTFDLNEFVEPFIQEGTPDEPIVYWLDVQASPMDYDPECRFGWKTSPEHWNDDAVWAEGMEPYNGLWNELIYPDGHPLAGQSIDLAFEILGYENPYILVDLHAFLEGPYNGTDMNTDLNDAGLLPLSHPYGIGPWSYLGTESVAVIPSTDVVDWLLVELRETPGGPASADATTMIARKASFLLKDNSVVAMDGVSYLKFYNTIAANLYAIIWHRNHLGILSQYPVLPLSGVYSYDFTTPAGQAYLNGQKDLGGVFGLYGGDGVPNGTINYNDKLNTWTPEAGTTGYKPGDFNLDIQVDNKDKDDIWVPNLGEGTKVP